MKWIILSVQLHKIGKREKHNVNGVGYISDEDMLLAYVKM